MANVQHSLFSNWGQPWTEMRHTHWGARELGAKIKCRCSVDPCKIFYNLDNVVDANGNLKCRGTVNIILSVILNKKKTLDQWLSPSSHLRHFFGDLRPPQSLTPWKLGKSDRWGFIFLEILRAPVQVEERLDDVSIDKALAGLVLLVTGHGTGVKRGFVQFLQSYFSPLERSPDWVFDPAHRLDGFRQPLLKLE